MLSSVKWAKTCLTKNLFSFISTKVQGEEKSKCV